MKLKELLEITNEQISIYELVDSDVFKHRVANKLYPEEFSESYDYQRECKALEKLKEYEVVEFCIENGENWYGLEIKYLDVEVKR